MARLSSAAVEQIVVACLVPRIEAGASLRAILWKPARSKKGSALVVSN